MNQITIAQIEPLFAEAGFSPYKGLLWYSCSGGLLRIVGFEKKTSDYSALYCIHPLFDYHDTLILTYGDDLLHRAIRLHQSDYGDLILRKEMPSDEFDKHFSNVMRVFENEIIPFLIRIKNVDDLCDALERSKMFFAPAPAVLRLRAYCKLYAGHDSDSRKLFGAYADSLKNSVYKDTAALLSEPNTLTKLIGTAPEEAHRLLQNNVERSMSCLHIKG